MFLNSLLDEDRNTQKKLHSKKGHAMIPSWGIQVFGVVLCKTAARGVLGKEVFYSQLTVVIHKGEHPE